MSLLDVLSVHQVHLVMMSSNSTSKALHLDGACTMYGNPTDVLFVLRLNRAAQHELDKDSCDKNMALNLDSTCQQLRYTSRGLQYHQGIEQVDNS